MAMPIMSSLPGPHGDLRKIWNFLIDPPRGNGNPGSKHPVPSTVGDTVELTGSIETLKISVQMRLEKGVVDGAGKELGTRVIDLNLHYNSVRFAFGEAQAASPENEESGETADAPAETEKNPFLAKLLEYVSPEKTADRIAGFVLKGFGKTSFGAQPTAESRKNFVDFISPFIRQGVDGALNTFGDALPDEIRDTAEETWRMIGERLSGFIDPGAAAESAA